MVEIPESRAVEVLGRTSGNLAEIALHGRLSAADRDVLETKLRALVEEHGKRRLLFHLTDVESFDVDADAWSAKSLDMALDPEVERIALVVSPDHAERALRVFGPLAPGRARVFVPSEVELAWSWVSSA